MQIGPNITILGNFVRALALVLNSVLEIYLWIVIAACVISWVNPDPYNPVVRFLRSVTEPAFGFVRRVLPFLPQVGLDFSPIIVLFAVYFLQKFLVPTLLQIAYNLPF